MSNAYESQLGPELVAALMEHDATCLRILGKSIMDCSPDELTTLVAEVYAEAAASQAAAERGEMALREAERCGCLIAVHGADVGSARVVHTCGAVA